MTQRIDTERELTNLEALRLIRRAFSYVWPLRVRFAERVQRDARA